MWPFSISSDTTEWVPGELHHSILAQPIGPAVTDVGNEAAALSQQDSDERGAHIPETCFAGAFQLQLFALFGNYFFEQRSYRPRGADLQSVEGVFDHHGQILGDDSGCEGAAPVAAHTIGYEKQRRLRISKKAVLVFLALFSDMRLGTPAEMSGRTDNEHLFRLLSHSRLLMLNESDKALLTPGAIIPERRIHRPAAARAYFREGPNLPGPANLPAAPGTITHEAHEFSIAVFAVAVVSRARRACCSRRSETWPETPRTETPLGQNAPATARANMAERSTRIETIVIAATPRTYHHALGDRLTAIDTTENDGDHRRIAFDERSAAHLLPIEFFSPGRFQEGHELEFPGNRLEQGRAHLLSISESLVGINRQCLLEKSDECQIGFFPEALVAPGRPAKRPFGQDAGEVLVQYEPKSETIAAVGRPAVCLLRSDISGRAEVVDGYHSSFELQTDPEIAERGPAVRKQENVAGRHVAMNHPLVVGVGKAVKDLGGDRDDSAYAHRFRAVGERTDGQLGRQDGLTAYNISILNRHNVWMTQLCNQADFTQQGLVIPLAIYVGQRNLQGHPDALDSIPGLPDLATSAFAEVFCQSVFAQSLAGFEVKTRRASRLAFLCIS